MASPLGHYSAATIHRADRRLLSDNYSFAVIRDPLERAVSAYRFARQAPTGAMAIAQPWRYRSSQFDSFDVFACEWLPQQDPAHVDGVFRSQSHYVVIDGRVAVQELFHFTDLAGLAVRLSDLAQREIVLGRQDVTAGAPVTSISAAARASIRHYYRADYDVISSMAGGNSTLRSRLAAG